jgi:hypothetical protein
VAGGDGTQALVAGIAAGRDIPMMVISAGTRNHFALDLGLDCDDPSTCLDALSDGVKIASAAQAAGLPSAGQRSRGLTMLTAREVIIDADQPQIPVGIDGESVLMPTHPGTLHHPPARTTSASPPRPARRPRATAATGLGTPAPPGAHLHAKPRAAANIQLADRAGLSHIPEQRDHDERLLKALS